MLEEKEMFSKEYVSDAGTPVGADLKGKLQQTNMPIDSKQYGISKPKRIITTSKIFHDKS